MSTWFNSLKQRFSKKSRDSMGAEEHETSIQPAVVIPQNEPASTPAYKALFSGGTFEWVLFVLGLLFFASLVLGLISFTRPLLQEVPANISYQQAGTYAYSAQAPAGVYDTGMLVSGEPIFPKLNCQVMLDFKYSFLGDQFQGLTGTHQVTALVGESTSGWQRNLPLESLTTFSGNTFDVSVPLDICQAEAITASMENETDMHPAL
jgi:hypothetical protein